MARHGHPPAPPFHPHRPGLMRPVRVDPDGRTGPTPRQAVGPRWTRSSRGLYLPNGLSDDLALEQRIVSAGVLCPAYGGVTGWAALRWLGAHWFDGRCDGKERPVTLAVARSDVRPQPGVSVSSEILLPEDLTVVDGLAITTALRAATFEARYAPDGYAAVRALDLALMFDLVTPEELIEYGQRRLVPMTGIAKLDAAIGLCSENAWSPAEVDMRLLWVLDLGLPTPLCNHPVFDLAGRHIGTPDLLDVEAGLVGEYDGIDHQSKDRRVVDLRREAAFRRVGLEYVVMVAADRRDPDAYLSRVADARERGLANRHERAWTVKPPAWWTPTVTVEQRRALSTEQRKRLLRWRRAA